MAVIVNGLTIVHQGSNGVALASAPDVCKTPAPGGPVPLPYPNLARSADLVDGTTTVKVEGHSVAVSGCAFGTSTGDEPGSAGGVASGVTKGKAKFLNYSFDVKCEGKSACRLSDPMSMNGNQANTLTEAEKQAAAIKGKIGDQAYEMLCQAFCWCEAGKDPKDIVKVKKVPAGGKMEA